jgi:quinol monooxygenase YgiN
MRQIYLIARYRIHPGMLEHFQQVAQECLGLAQRKDRGTLCYDWYLSDDRRLCVTIERYAGCDALLAHVANLDLALDRLMSTADLSLELFGTASQEVLAATEELPINFYSRFQSLDIDEDH